MMLVSIGFANYLIGRRSIKIMGIKAMELLLKPSAKLHYWQNWRMSERFALETKEGLGFEAVGFGSSSSKGSLSKWLSADVLASNPIASSLSLNRIERP